jgi:hypothetical protein
MTACIRTAGLRGESTDKAVGYAPCAVCLHYMTEDGSRSVRLFLSVTAHQTKELPAFID